MKNTKFKYKLKNYFVATGQIFVSTAVIAVSEVLSAFLRAPVLQIHAHVQIHHYFFFHQFMGLN